MNYEIILGHHNDIRGNIESDVVYKISCMTFLVLLK